MFFSLPLGRKRGGVFPISPCPPKTACLPVRWRAVGVPLACRWRAVGVPLACRWRAVGVPSPRAASAGGGGWVRGGSVRGCSPCGLSRTKGGGRVRGGSVRRCSPCGFSRGKGGGRVRGGSVRRCPPCGFSRGKGGGWRHEPRQSVFRSFGCLVSAFGGIRGYRHSSPPSSVPRLPSLPLSLLAAARAATLPPCPC